MNAYSPADGVYIGSPPCRHCGRNYYLHGPAALTREQRRRMAEAGTLRCPSEYRETNLERAYDELRVAEASGDQQRIFIARGDVQRLEHAAELEGRRRGG